MHGSTVFLIAFLTSVVTTTCSVVLIERLDLTSKLRGDPELTEVPELRGLPEADARENLKAQRLTLLVKAREPSREGKPGTVIGQSVPGGQKVPVGHPVAVTLAEAAPSVPSLSGLSVDEATLRLAKQGWVLKVGEPVQDPEVPEGKIVAQAPAADATLEKDGVVTVQLSAGGGAIDMPKVVGKGLNAAKADLEKLGLTLAPVRWVSIAETATFVVLNQKPEAGEKVKPGSEVQLTANR